MAAADGELWNLIVTSVPGEDDIDAWFENALQQREQGREHPFAIRRLKDQRIIGSTRFYDIEPGHRNLAIGYTWYSKSAQRTAINTECKLMLLTYAFEDLAAISVAFHTHHRNFASQRAIERLGAVRDGVLRNHKIMPDGTPRDTVCYSIINSEWPTVKARLKSYLSVGDRRRS